MTEISDAARKRIPITDRLRAAVHGIDATQDSASIRRGIAQLLAEAADEIDALRHKSKSYEDGVRDGYDACRKSVYAVCEDMQEGADRIRISASVKSAAEEQHAKGYHAGTRVTAKSIARTFNSLGYEDDNLLALLPNSGGRG